MEVACPGDTIAVLPDDGVVKVDRSIVRVGQELRCIQPGIRIEGDRQYRIQTNLKRYNSVVEQDRVLGLVTGVPLFPTSTKHSLLFLPVHCEESRMRQPVSLTEETCRELLRRV